MDSKPKDERGEGSGHHRLGVVEEEHKCRTVMVMKVATIAVHMLIFVLALVLCNGLHILLRPLSQPRIISESLVGFFLSNLPPVRDNINDEAKRTLTYLADFGMICHMFVVGLEMDHKIFLKLPIREAKVACTGFLTTFIISIFITPLLNVSIITSLKFDVALSIILSGTASPHLTRLINDLKISKSDIGRFVVSAAVISDLVSILLISLGYIIFDPSRNFKTRSLQSMLLMSATLVIQTVLAAKVSPILMRWVNSENPQGKPMKGSYLIVSIAYVVIVSGFSPSVGQFNKPLSALLAGVFMPREGRIAKMIISKVKYFFSLLFFPAFFFWVGLEIEFSQFGGGHIGTWARFFFIFVLTVGGRIVGSLISGVMLGFHWQETVAIGLLLSIKGHFHIYLAIFAARMGLVSMSTSTVMVFIVFLTFLHTPLVVQNIIERARKRSPTQRMALQWLNASNELRLILCLHGPKNVQAAINFMEISRGPPDPGMMIYLTDMIEMTDKIAATLARGEGVDAMTVTDRGVIEMREKISNSVKGYLEDDCEGIGMHRLLALSPFSIMHQDICTLAEDLLVSIIILPFHKDQEADGTLNTGHSGFRNVNRKVLRYAPCSVGILVDRGLGTTQISRTSISLTAAIIFIGGKDDREALAYSGRVARHPGVKLTVIRFLLDAAGDSVTSRISRARANTAEYEEEMKLDDEYFAEFYDRHVAGGRVAYVEKYLMNSGQTFSTLRSLEGQYALFIVGRGGRVNSVLTVGMNDWEECPELGPIGDILSASDFSITTSVLVIQQHSLRGELHGLQDEFSIM